MNPNSNHWIYKKLKLSKKNAYNIHLSESVEAVSSSSELSEKPLPAVPETYTIIQLGKGYFIDNRMDLKTFPGTLYLKIIVKQI